MALVNSTKHTQKKPRLRQLTDRIAFYDIRSRKERVYSFNPQPTRCLGARAHMERIKSWRHWKWKWQLIINNSLRFNGHFPGEPGLAGVYWSKGWWRWWVGEWWQLDYWSCKSCKAPVKSSPHTNQHPVFFYRPDALPVAQPTMSKHWRENITFHKLAYPKLTWGSSKCVSDHY